MDSRTRINLVHYKGLHNETVVNAVNPKCNKWKDGKQLCKYFGYTHGTSAKCPAYGKTCAKYQGTNHFASACMKSEGPRNKDDKITETNKKIKNKKRAGHEAAAEESDSRTANEFYVD